MFIKKSLAIALLIFFTSVGLKAALGPVDPVVYNINGLLTAVNPVNYQSSVAVASRAEIMKLNADQLRNVIAANPNGVFNSPYGFSLIHGWMLNQLANQRVPFYVNQHFSFDKYISNMIAATRAPATIHAMWLKTRAAIEANRWEYYKHMQYIPAAIAQAGIVHGAAIGADVIKPAYVQALNPADFDAHAESIVNVVLKPSDMKARFESVMLWLLKFYNIPLLLPADYEINKAEEFVLHVCMKCPGVAKPRIHEAARNAANQGQAAKDEERNALLTSLVNIAHFYYSHGGIETTEAQLKAYATPQPRGNPADGVPNLAAAG